MNEGHAVHTSCVELRLEVDDDCLAVISMQALNATLYLPSINATLSGATPSWLTVFQYFVQVNWCRWPRGASHPCLTHTTVHGPGNSIFLHLVCRAGGDEVAYGPFGSLFQPLHELFGQGQLHRYRRGTA